jgi:hypothetical protein
MRKSVILAPVFLALMAAPAFAQDCSDPIPPAVPDGRTATMQQITSTTQDFKRYQKDADDYADCLTAYLRAQQAKASHDKKDLDPSISANVGAKQDDIQREKVKVGQEVNASVHGFCQANPKTAGCDKVLAPPPSQPQQ